MSSTQKNPSTTLNTTTNPTTLNKVVNGLFLSQHNIVLKSILLSFSTLYHLLPSPLQAWFYLFFSRIFTKINDYNIQKSINNPYYRITAPYYIYPSTIYLLKHLIGVGILTFISRNKSKALVPLVTLIYPAVSTSLGLATEVSTKVKDSWLVYWTIIATAQLSKKIGIIKSTKKSDWLMVVASVLLMHPDIDFKSKVLTWINYVFEKDHTKSNNKKIVSEKKPIYTGRTNGIELNDEYELPNINKNQNINEESTGILNGGIDLNKDDEVGSGYEDEDKGMEVDEEELKIDLDEDGINTDENTTEENTNVWHQ